MIYNRKHSLTAFKCRLMALLSSVLFANSQLFAQSDSSNVASSDTSINVTTKTIFQEASKSVGSKDTLTGIIMIILVLAVVVIALYLSFKSPNSALKRKKVIERQQKRGHQTN
jgi:hypothetical protein